MNSSVRYLLIASAVLTGCASCGSASPPPAPQPNAPTGAATPVPAATSALVLAGEHGLQEISVSGQVTRTLSATPIRFAIRLPDHSGYVTYSDGNTSTIRIVRSDGTGERVVAELPTGLDGCNLRGRATDRAPIAINARRDARLDAMGGTLCMTLSDRNENMRDYQVAARLDLATGRFESEVEMAEGCPQRVSSLMESCASHSLETPIEEAHNWPFSVTEEGAIMQGDRLYVQTRAQNESDPVRVTRESQSGRWQLLATSAGEGDYIYHSVHIFDRSDGSVRNIRVGEWPAPIPREALARVETFGAGATEENSPYPTLSMHGEASEWFVNDSLLVVGPYVIELGRAVREVSGEIVH